MILRYYPTLKNITPAWGTLYALSLVRVVVTAFVLMSAFILELPLISAGQIAVSHRSLAVLVMYFLLAVLMAMTTARYVHRYVLQVIGQLAIDLLITSILVVMGDGIRSEFVVFYLIPIAGASLMLPTSAAFFSASLAVLTLLADAAWRGMAGGDHADPRLFQTGLYGASLFGLAGLLRMLASRLDTQATLAQARGEDLRSQFEVNRLMLAQMDQGVIVVDGDGRVRANNHAAAMLLGIGPEKDLSGQSLASLPGTRVLAEEFLKWRSRQNDLFGWQDRTFLMQVDVRDGVAEETRKIHRTLRTRFVPPQAYPASDFVVFLEDQKGVEERAQQLKLAAMGRLTASIAHEIRNPLAAIANAGQLMSEAPPDEMSARLARIVRENTARLDRIVGDVLRVARREPPRDEALLLHQFVRTWLSELVRDRGIQAETLALTMAAEHDVVRFEQDHLRQILFNLVDNALRFASGTKACVELRIEAQAHAADARAPISLWVFDDGPGISDQDRTAIFEPFFTTHARGTGLGLYLAREFCLVNQANLFYDTWRAPDRSRERSGFVIRFAQNPPEIAVPPSSQERIDRVIGFP